MILSRPLRFLIKSVDFFDKVMYTILIKSIIRVKKMTFQCFFTGKALPCSAFYNYKRKK